MPWKEMMLVEERAKFLLLEWGRRWDEGEGRMNFDRFRREPASSAFVASPRRHPRPMLRFRAELWGRPLRVDETGLITWNEARLFLSTALVHEDVELRYLETGCQWISPVAQAGVFDRRGGPAADAAGVCQPRTDSARACAHERAAPASASPATASVRLERAGVRDARPRSRLRAHAPQRRRHA